MRESFVGEIIEWRGPAPYYFVSVPQEVGSAIRAAAAAAGGSNWGTVQVRAALRSTEWKTSLWSRDGDYLLPLKDAVRKPAGLGAGDTVELHLTFEPNPQTKQAQSKQRRSDPPRSGQPQSGRASASRAPRVVGSREPVTPEQLTIVPANQATFEDLQAIFGTGGDTGRCWCQRFRMLPKESWASEGPEELAARLRDQTACGTPTAPNTTGLIAYLTPPEAPAGSPTTRSPGAPATEPASGIGAPVGWCAVAPRAGHARLVRDYRVPWLGRDEDRADATVWAVTCFVTRLGYRRRGISRLLARAAVDFARERGARAVEGYPDLVDGGSVGSLATFADAGFAEVSQPGNRRAVLRIDF
jgi:GNAT superfamily N-acetyltransferase